MLRKNDTPTLPYRLHMSLWERWYHHVWCRYRYTHTPIVHLCCVITGILSIVLSVQFTGPAVCITIPQAPTLHTTYYRILTRVLPWYSAPYLTKVAGTLAAALPIASLRTVIQVYRTYLDTQARLYDRIPPWWTTDAARRYCHTLLDEIVAAHPDHGR